MNEFPQLQAIQQLGRTYRVLMAAFERQIGHSMPRWRILLTLHQSGETSQKQLAHLLRMDPASLTRQIKEIERKGWIERHSDATDNRLTNVELTAEGRRVVKAALPRRKAFIEHAFGDMPVDEMNALTAMLHAMEESLKKELEDEPMHEG